MLLVENHHVNNPRCEIGLIGLIGEIRFWPEGGRLRVGQSNRPFKSVSH